MARNSGTRGRALVLIILILVTIAGGIVWYDWLGIIDAKDLFRPVYARFGLDTRSAKRMDPARADLFDAERVAALEEGLSVKEEDLKRRSEDLDRRDNDINQKAQELEERQKALDDQEKSLREKAKAADNKKANVERNAQRLTSMPPGNAVAIIEAMNDQDIIDVLRAVDELASRAGTASIVPFWMSKMDAKRAADIQRKMVHKPLSLQEEAASAAPKESPGI